MSHFGVRGDEVVEALFRDDEQLGVLDRLDVLLVRSAVQQRHLAEEVALTEHAQLVAPVSENPDGTGDHDVQAVRRRALREYLRAGAPAEVRGVADDRQEGSVV